MCLFVCLFYTAVGKGSRIYDVFFFKWRLRVETLESNVNYFLSLLTPKISGGSLYEAFLNFRGRKLKYVDYLCPTNKIVHHFFYSFFICPNLLRVYE